MSRITEAELILPTLLLLDNEDDKSLSTTLLIQKLRDYLKPIDEDLSILDGRSDDKFSQKVRNLRSHKTLERKGFCTYEDGTFTLTQAGKDYLEDNRIYLYENETISTYYDEFLNSIQSLKNLLRETDSLGNRNYLYNILYSSSITNMETYLYDALKSNILGQVRFYRNFVENYTDYKDEKISYSEIFNKYVDLENKVLKDISKLLYHNLPKIKKIYKDTFDIDFPNIAILMPSIKIRHDIVHRNGKDEEGNIHHITKANIEELLGNIEDFVKDINEKLDYILGNLEE